MQPTDLGAVPAEGPAGATAAGEVGPKPRPRRPGWVAIAFLILAELILLGLGAWQLQRRAWKRDLLASIAERQSLPVAPLPPGFDTQEWIYRHVTVTGTFRSDALVRLGGRQIDRTPGYHQLLLLERADGGAPILVNRGFVPEVRGATGTPAQEGGEPLPPQGPQTVTGIVSVPASRGVLSLANDPAQGRFVRADLEELQAYLKLPALAPALLVVPASRDEAADRAQRPVPVGGIVIEDIPNDHLMYALTWFSLAFVLIVMAWVRLRQPQPASLPDIAAPAAADAPRL